MDSNVVSSHLSFNGDRENDILSPAVSSGGGRGGGRGGGFFLACEDFWRMADNSFHVCAFFFFYSGD